MGFSPTNDNLDPRQPWRNTYFNTLIDDIQAFAASIDGTDMADPLTMNGQLDGNGKLIYGFTRWGGTGADNQTAWRDVCGFGATGNGATDDTAAIQSAIDDLAIPSNLPGGGVIFFPPGKYKISSPLLMSTGSRHNVTLQGCGEATMISLANSSDCTMIRATSSGSSIRGMVIRDMRINGNDSNQSSAAFGIDLQDTVRAKVERCRIEDIKGSGIRIGDSFYAHIDQCFLDGCTENGIETGDITICYDARITNCWIRSSDENGIELTRPPIRMIISGNHFNGNKLSGIAMYYNGGSSGEDLQIMGNRFASDGVTGSKSTIYIDLNGGANLENLKISDNVINDSYGHGIDIQGTGLTSYIKNFSVTGNTINNAGRASGAMNGIVVYENVHYGAITGNTVRNSTYSGIGVFGPDANGKVTYISVTGNCCGDDRGAQDEQDYGINLGAYSEDCCAIGNTVYDANVANIIDNGTRNEVAHNPGF